jgi:hypothetical protein
MRRCAVILLLGGCGPEVLNDGRHDADPPRGCTDMMFDSLGAPYPVADSGVCFPSVGDDTPVGWAGTGDCEGSFDGSEPSVVFSWARFFAACPGCGRGFASHHCRPLVCETDEDCPYFLTNRDDETVVREYECRNSLCQDSDTDLYPVDVLNRSAAQLLCFAAVARRDDEYLGGPICPGVDVGSQEPCPLPLPDACMQP